MKLTQRNILRDRDLPNTSQLTCRDTFLIDHSQLNKSILKATHGAAAHPWEGPIIALKKHGLGMHGSQTLPRHRPAHLRLRNPTPPSPSPTTTPLPQPHRSDTKPRRHVRAYEEIPEFVIHRFRPPSPLPLPKPGVLSSLRVLYYTISLVIPESIRYESRSTDSAIIRPDGLGKTTNWEDRLLVRKRPRHFPISGIRRRQSCVGGGAQDGVGGVLVVRSDGLEM